MVFRPPSAKCLQISSTLPCAPLIVAVTAADVVDCNASAFNPALALDTPVRFSLASSKYPRTGKASLPTKGTANGCTIPGALILIG